MDPLTFHEGYRIGDRWAGTKQIHRCDPVKLQAFRYWLHTEARSTSALSRDDPSWLSKVDAKWNEMFPHGQRVRCPLPGYDRGGASLPGDVLQLADVPQSLGCYRLIVAGHSYTPNTGKHNGPLAVDFMLIADREGDLPPGIWDGRVLSGLELYRLHRENHPDKYPAKSSPTNDWLAVTVTYYG